MGGELEGEDSSAMVAEIAATKVTVRGGLFLLGLEGLAGEEVAQRRHLRVDDDIHRDGLIVEVLDDERAVVVGEEGYLRGTFDISPGIETHGTADDVEGLCGIVVEVAEVVGDGEHEEGALGVGVTQQDGIAGDTTIERTCQPKSLTMAFRSPQ